MRWQSRFLCANPDRTALRRIAIFTYKTVLVAGCAGTVLYLQAGRTAVSVIFAILTLSLAIVFLAAEHGGQPAADSESSSPM